MEIEDGGDTGMIQFGEGMRLVDEAAMGVGVGDQSGMQEFDGDFAIEVGVVSAVDNTHSSATDSLENAIVAELETEQRILEGGRVGHGKYSFPCELQVEGSPARMGKSMESREPLADS